MDFRLIKEHLFLHSRPLRSTVLAPLLPRTLCRDILQRLRRLHRRSTLRLLLLCMVRGPTWPRSRSGSMTSRTRRLSSLCLGEAAVDFAVPEDPTHGHDWVLLRCLALLRLGLLVDDADDKGAACGWLEGDFAEGEREGGEELLCVLAMLVSTCSVPRSSGTCADVRRRRAASICIACRTGW